MERRIESPEYAVDNRAVLLGWSASTTVLGFDWQQAFQNTPLRFGQITPAQICLQKAVLNQAIVCGSNAFVIRLRLGPVMQGAIYDEGAAVNRFSQIVTEGMRQVCPDFSETVSLSGFRKTKSRTWVRLNDCRAECIYFHRHGSTYGAPRNGSVDLRVMLSIRVLNAAIAGGSIGIISDQARRKSGYAYHHRTEVAEPWFSEWRDPRRLMTHEELSIEAREGLASAISGHASAETVAVSLKALGIKARS